ncbi:MAG: hypothetical protein M3209_04525 [Acidobacteriota bacterium]|nr:hypothetical protein [Acidobacteriota bacterium]
MRLETAKIAANVKSVLFRVEETIFPIPNPNSLVIPKALNSSGASKNAIA